MGEDQIRKLEMRIKQLEDQLEGQRAQVEPADVTADEIRAYQKVRNMIVANWDLECGINECMPVLPCRAPVGCWTPVRPPRACIQECFCGPCNFGGWGHTGGGFSGLGQ